MPVVNQAVAKPRNMPVVWAVVFAVVCTVGALPIGMIAGYEAGRDRAPRPERVFVDEVKLGRGLSDSTESWQLRWIEDGMPRIVQVDSEEARERVRAWLEGR